MVSPDEIRSAQTRAKFYMRRYNPTPHSVLVDARRRFKQCQRDGRPMSGEIPPEIRADVLLYNYGLLENYQQAVTSGSHSPRCVTETDFFPDHKPSDFTPYTIPGARKGKCKLCSRKKRRKRRRKSKRRR